MKRKLLALSLCIALLAVAVVGGTLAYFSDSDDARNTFTVGNVDILLEEPHWEGNPDATGKKDAPEVYPGEALMKDPMVTNTGKNPCFVRVEVIGLDSLVPEGVTGEEAEKWKIGLRYIDANGDYHAGYNTDDWEYYDGYFYYKHVLATEETKGNEYNQGLTDVTTPVFSQVVMPTALENGDGTTEYHIDVKAYAVQAQGAQASWGDVKQMAVTGENGIAKWFETCAPTWSKTGEMNTINPIPAQTEAPSEDPAPEDPAPENPAPENPVEP